MSETTTYGMMHEPDDTEALRRRMESAEEALAIFRTSANELLEILRYKWGNAAAETDAMTLYLCSFLAGISAEWLKVMPPNGFTCECLFPELGRLAIDVRKVDSQNSVKRLTDLHTLYPASEWHEDFGDVLWWHLPVCEPPIVGSGVGMNETQANGEPTTCRRLLESGWLTHWSPLPDARVFKVSEAKTEPAE